jgi:5-methylcytosine-specific restriction endonuclease McrA
MMQKSRQRALANQRLPSHAARSPERSAAAFSLDPWQLQQTFDRPIAAPPSSVLAVQRIYGNRAVQRMIEPSIATLSPAPLRITPAPHATIQRHCYRYGEPGPYTALDKEHALDSDKIAKHFRKGFTGTQRTNIIEANKKRHGGVIKSDETGEQLVELKDTVDTLAHIDHIFPKQKGGSNSYSNAEVMAARKNLRKNSTLGANAGKSEDASPQGLYKGLEPGFVASAFTNFTSDQRTKILAKNKELTKSLTGFDDTVLPDAELIAIKKGALDKDNAVKLEGGIDTSRVLHVDHILPQKKGGCNFYRNARIISAAENISKSDSLGELEVDESEVVEEAENEDYEEHEWPLKRMLKKIKQETSVEKIVEKDIESKKEVTKKKREEKVTKKRTEKKA